MDSGGKLDSSIIHLRMAPGSPVKLKYLRHLGTLKNSLLVLLTTIPFSETLWLLFIFCIISIATSLHHMYFIDIYTAGTTAKN